MSLSEFALIEKYFSLSGKHRSGEARFGEKAVDNSVVQGVGDDGALLTLPANEQLVVSVDTLVSGVHFPDGADPADIARRLLRVNLSDMAAMGATPRWFTLALTLPGVKEDWLALFSSALVEDAAVFGCQLVGGDTTAGLLTLSINMLGLVPPGEALLRSGAQPGDLVYVTGCLGDAAAALSVIKGFSAELSGDSDYLLSRFYRPAPRLIEGCRLRGIASAAIDVSDGLLADLGHIAERSGVGAEIYQGQLPLSDSLKKASDQQQVARWALTGGDDYELCFTVPEKKQDIVEAMIALGELDATAIGRIIEGSGVVCRDEGGGTLDFGRQGYQHF